MDRGLGLFYWPNLSGETQLSKKEEEEEEEGNTIKVQQIIIFVDTNSNVVKNYLYTKYKKHSAVGKK
jgi:hypothetical protein